MKSRICFNVLPLFIISTCTVRQSVEIQAATDAARTILSDTIWTGGDTIRMTRNIIVTATAQLTIQPGAVIQFRHDAGLFVRGALRAEGTQSRPIVFTSLADTSGGSPVSEMWSGLNFLPGSKGDLSGCHIRYAVTGVLVNRSSVVLEDCLIEDFTSQGIFIKGATAKELFSAEVNNCTIRQTDPYLRGTGDGIRVYRSVHATISRCHISNCQYGIHLRGNNADAPQFSIAHCTIRDNADYGIYIPWVG